jgi:hypothetical protein
VDIRRELVLLTSSAILGAAAGYVIRAAGVVGGFRWPVFVLLLLALALVFIQLGPLPLILRRPGSVELSDDHWNFVYSYVKLEGTVTVWGVLRVKQYGSYLRGQGRSTRVEGPTKVKSFVYDMTGEVHSERLVSGRFVDTIEGRGHWGVFQARVDENGTRVEARWVGKGHNELHSGTWIWERPPLEV